MYNLFRISYFHSVSQFAPDFLQKGPHNIVHSWFVKFDRSLISDIRSVSCESDDGYALNVKGKTLRYVRLYEMGMTRIYEI